MSTTTEQAVTPAETTTKPRSGKLSKLVEKALADPPPETPAESKPETKKAPEKKPAEKKPDYLRTVKGEVQQRCTKCSKWKPVETDYAKKSKARGGGPIRVCRACIKL